MTPTCPVLFPVRVITIIALAALGGWPASSQVDSHQAHVEVREVRLDNGLKLLLVHQPESTAVAAGWMVGAGSADDPRDRTGLSHLLEHMMFKGTESVGTRDFAAERGLLEQIDELWEERSAWRQRLVDASGKKRAKGVKQIEAMTTDLRALEHRAAELAYQGEYSLLYSEQGGTGLDANTLYDMTLYLVTLPADRLELWFWLESDRLLRPVFRQFHREVSVVLEERRLRIGSTPTGALDEKVRKLFWKEHPYAWNPMGEGNHLESIGRPDAVDFFRRHYRAGNLTAALVGAFDPHQVERWARLYFGRLPGDSSEGSVTSRAKSGSFTEQRFEERCLCPPQARVLYPTPRFGERDNYALQLLAAIMNGRTGRLYRGLVLDRQIAFAAFTQQVSWKQAGVFTFEAESKGAADPTSLIDAWDQELARLRAEPPSTEETDRARSRLTADAFRTLKEPAGLLKQLLIYEGLGDWRYLNRWSSRLQEVSPEDIVTVAEKYLVPHRRTLAIYRRVGDPTATGTSPRTEAPMADRRAP